MSTQISSDKNIPVLQSSNHDMGGFPLLAAFSSIWQKSRIAFSESRTHSLCHSVAIGLLTAFGRRTITNTLCARGRQFVDWSFMYRFFSKDKWSPTVLRHQTLLHFSRYLTPGAPLVVALDDSECKKTGRHIPASGYFYDPQSPKFAKSFAWAVRFHSISAIHTPYGPCGPARGIPLGWTLAPTLGKPSKKATPEERKQHDRNTRNWSLSTQGVEQIGLLRAEMDGVPDLSDRPLIVSVDGSYCNRTVLKNLPERTILIGRTRKDIKIFEIASVSHTGTRGRIRRYGKQLPTPEEIRKDDTNYPWHTCQVFAAGSWHTVRYKTISPILWECAGAKRTLRLIVIAPLRCGRNKKGKLLYRDPAYLIVTDPDYPAQTALQHYFHRWEIEVNHRDVKDGLGLGDAQVRHPMSVSRILTFHSLIYSWLLLASMDAYGPGRGNQYMPRAKWRNDHVSRPSISDLAAQLRLELYLYESGQTSIPFFTGSREDANPGKYAIEAEQWLAQTVPKQLSSELLSAILYARA